MAPAYVGIDLGGTTIRTGAVTEAGQSLSRVIRQTEAHAGPDAVIAQMAESVHAALDEAGLNLDGIRGIGIGAPGTLDRRAGIILEPPNLPGWRDVPLVAELERALKPPVVRISYRAAPLTANSLPSTVAMSRTNTPGSDENGARPGTDLIA